MLRLTLVRHAKSSWADEKTKDFDRPLKERGFSDADLMADLVKEKNLIPDKIISSPALRAKTTAKIFAKKFKIKDIELDENIYYKGLNEIEEIIALTDDKVKHLMLFGHQPYIAALHSYFTGDFLTHIPTTGISHLSFQLNNWEAISANTASSIFVVYPKMFK